MAQFFKGTEEKKPFAYPIITDIRKGSNNYTGWIIGIIALLTVVGAAFLIFR